jgi:hypothetical protein
MLPLSPSANPPQEQKRTATDQGTLESRVSHSYQPIEPDDTAMKSDSGLAGDDGDGSEGEYEGPEGEHESPEVSARPMV